MRQPQNDLNYDEFGLVAKLLSKLVATCCSIADVRQIEVWEIKKKKKPHTNLFPRTVASNYAYITWWLDEGELNDTSTPVTMLCVNKGHNKLN